MRRYHFFSEWAELVEYEYLHFGTHPYRCRVLNNNGVELSAHILQVRVEYSTPVSVPIPVFDIGICASLIILLYAMIIYYSIQCGEGFPPASVHYLLRDTANAVRRRLSRHVCHSRIFADPVIVEAAEGEESSLCVFPDRLPLLLLSDDQILRLVLRRRRRLTSAPSSSSPSCRANDTVPLTSDRHTNTALRGLSGGGGEGCEFTR